MKATAQSMRCMPCSAGEKTGNSSNAVRSRNCACANCTTVVESAGEQPWAEFCQSLDQPAFLMPVTGFGDLE